MENNGVIKLKESQIYKAKSNGILVFRVFKIFLGAGFAFIL
jgi:hypothetical protein